MKYHATTSSADQDTDPMTNTANQKPSLESATMPTDSWKKTLVREQKSVKVSGFEANESPNYSGQNSVVLDSGSKDPHLSKVKIIDEQMSKVLLQRVTQEYEYRQDEE